MNKKYAMSMLLLLIIFSKSLFAFSWREYPSYYTPSQILAILLTGEYQAKWKAVKWTATPGDMYEFNGQHGEKNTLYSLVDTTMVIDNGYEKVYYTIFRTAPMVIDEYGEFVNSNGCHICGIKLGYFSYTIANDSISINQFKRNFAVHGSFGEKNYTLSMINLGDGYELLKVDDPYDGMGVASVTTKFYQDGELILSMISKENNLGNREKTQKGYYEFKTEYAYNTKAHTITIKQRGYKINEQSGKRVSINKIKKLNFDSYSLQF
jgi:hypothetical protein